MVFIITLLAAISALAVALVTPVTYLFGIDHIKLPNGYVFSLIAYSPLALVVWAVSNALSGVSEQEHKGLYLMDNTCSWIALISINITFLTVLIAVAATGQSTFPTIAESGAAQVLVAATLFTWLDIGYIQREKHKRLLRQLRGDLGTTTSTLRPTTIVPSGSGGSLTTDELAAAVAAGGRHPQPLGVDYVARVILVPGYRRSDGNFQEVHAGPLLGEAAPLTRLIDVTPTPPVGSAAGAGGSAAPSGTGVPPTP